MTYEKIQGLLAERERLSSKNAALRDQVEQLTGQVIGQGRIGVRMASLVSYLRTPLRLPFRAIQSFLATLHTQRLSVGAFVALTHAARQQLYL